MCRTTTGKKCIPLLCHVMSFEFPFILKKKMFQVEGSLDPLPKLPWWSHLFIHLFTKRDEPLTQKQNVGSTRRVTCVAGSPFCDGRITFLTGPTFLHINIWLVQPGQLSQSELNRACANAVSSGKRVNIFKSHANAGVR